MPAWTSVVSSHPITAKSTTPDSARDAELHAIALGAVKLAAVVTMERFRSPGLSVTNKSSAADVVTDADVASECTVREYVLAARPDDGFLGEEGTSLTGTSGISWILDPIDSTANFARGIPIWSISLAAKDQSGVVIGVVACPPHNEVISASRESGIVLNGAVAPTAPPRELQASMIAIGWGSRSDGKREAKVAGAIVPAVGKVRSPGSPALGLAWTAIGRFDAAFYEMDFNEWDIAAGGFLCEQAGLIVTERRPDNPGESRRLLASPTSLHATLSDLVF